MKYIKIKKRKTKEIRMFVKENKANKDRKQKRKERHGKKKTKNNQRNAFGKIECDNPPLPSSSSNIT